jgi:hypothetical protein
MLNGSNDVAWCEMPFVVKLPGKSVRSSYPLFTSKFLARGKIKPKQEGRFRVNGSVGDVTSGPKRPLKTEIGIPPFPTIENAPVRSKGLQMDGKSRWNTIRKTTIALSNRHFGFKRPLYLHKSIFRQCER